MIIVVRIMTFRSNFVTFNLSGKNNIKMTNIINNEIVNMTVHPDPLIERILKIALSNNTNNKNNDKKTFSMYN